MKKLLYINSCVNSEKSRTLHISTRLIEALKADCEIAKDSPFINISMIDCQVKCNKITKNVSSFIDNIKTTFEKADAAATDIFSHIEYNSL